MFMLKFFIVLSCAVHQSVQIDNTELFCSDEFCKSYRVTNKCREIPKNCNIQNVTHNGIFLPSDSPCNCCEYCLENLKKGDECVIGQPGSPAPKTICGNKLACNAQGKCDDMRFPCINDQKDWLNRKNAGTLGHMELKPQCDRNGNYMPVKCIPGQTCFCISKDGERIFGDFPFDKNAEYFKKCECSRTADLANKFFGDSLSIKSRCQSDGSYDQLQCILNKNIEKSLCVCVDPDDGYPDEKSYGYLPTVGKENFPKCFDEKIHEKGNYLRKCEKEYKNALDEIRNSKNAGIKMIGVRLPKCQLDGHYAAVQEDLQFKYCVYPNGQLIENYKVPKTDPSAATMNCNCARARSIIEGHDKPECCQNGNFKCLQRRRELYRCVDTNGVQTRNKESEDPNSLKCCKDTCT